jgi:Flp pilus assembly protein TadG
MPPSRRFHSFALADDRGSAALEFITAGFLLLIPLVYLILSMAAIQAGALSIEGASRQAARVFVQAPTVGSGTARAETALAIALSDFGIQHASAKLKISCRPHPGKCLTRRGFVTVTVSASVPLPFVPPVLAYNGPLSVPLRATSTEQVSRFWGAG